MAGDIVWVELDKNLITSADASAIFCSFRVSRSRKQVTRGAPSLDQRDSEEEHKSNKPLQNDQPHHQTGTLHRDYRTELAG